MSELKINPQNPIHLNNRRMSEHIADTLTTWIMDGTLQAGQRIREDELAEAFGVSRIPVREAIRSLSNRGLIETTPYVGSKVKIYSAKEIEEVYTLRCALEPIAGRIAAQKITPEELANLERLQSRLEEVCSQEKALRDTKLIYDLNREFHMALYRCSGMEILLQIINNLWDAIAYLRIQTAYSDAYPKQMQEEHREYLRLLREHDGETLASRMLVNLSRHLNNFRNSEATPAPA